MGKKKGSGKHKPSSGKRWLRKLKYQAMRLEMKIARWNRNQSNPDKESVWPTPFCKRNKPWDTTGLEKHLIFIKKLQKDGVNLKRL